MLTSGLGKSILASDFESGPESRLGKQVALASIADYGQ
jgi:hypothetical protein